MRSIRYFRRHCLSCRSLCGSKDYLCRDCWWSLSKDAQTALLKRDRKAFSRLLELRHQLGDGVALYSIRISP